MSALSRRHFLATTSLSAVALGTARYAQAQRRPNVLYVMTDQQRKDTLGCYGNPKTQTPHFDTLAEEGVLFTSCYATQPVCSPCRSSMVTGLFPNATTVMENNIPLPSTLFTWPGALREQGYKVGYVGKWHLGVDPVPDYFDLWRGFHTGWDHVIKEEPVYQNPGETEKAFAARIAGGDTSTRAGAEQVGRYRPDLEAEHAIEFIRSCGQAPFVCWLSFYPPHTPKTVPEENLALYRGKYESEDQDIYYAMVNRLDANLGRVLDTIDELGLRDHTLVVFTSDHGENHPQRWNNHHKRLCYDQAANVPLIMRWPAVLTEGKQIDKVISIADLAPTILDLCGQTWPETLHGQSAKRLLQGDSSGWHEDIFIQNVPYPDKSGGKEGVDLAMRERCVVTDRWKLILNTTRPPELYDRTSAKPDEVNLFGDPTVAEVVPDLVKRLAAWGKKTDDALTEQLIQQWGLG